MYRIAKEFHFSASHIIEGLPEGHKCGRLHGHNYVVRLYLIAEHLSEVGFVIDFGDLKPFKVWIDSELDHKHLNDHPYFSSMPTTAEGIARHLFMVAAEQFGPIVERVRVYETAKAWGEFSA